jgi:hypothetical protein
MPLRRLANILAAAVLLFALGRAYQIALVEKEGPRMMCIPDEANLGAVSVGIPVERKFVLRNFGTERLLLTEVKSTCQCTVASLGTRVIQPGATLTIIVTFKAKSAGPKAQDVILRTNDSVHPVSRIKITALAFTKIGGT